MRIYLAEVVEAALGDEREQHDDRADRRHDPRRRELQRRRLPLGRHLPRPAPQATPSPHVNRPPSPLPEAKRSGAAAVGWGGRDGKILGGAEAGAVSSAWKVETAAWLWLGRLDAFFCPPPTPCVLLSRRLAPFKSSRNPQTCLGSKANSVPRGAHESRHTALSVCLPLPVACGCGRRKRK